MSILAIDGFESTAFTTTFQRRYGVGLIPTFVTGRKGAGSAFEYASTTATTLALQLNRTAGPTIIVSMGFRFSDVQTTDFITLRIGGSEQIRLQFERVDAASGRFIVSRGGTDLGTSDVIPSDTWYFLEWLVTISDSAGRTEIRLDQVLFFEIDGVDTKLQISSAIDEVRIGLQCAASGTWQLDDLYVVGSADPAEDFLGDISVSGVTPLGDGATLDWDAQPGPVHVEQVDEDSSDDDATYIDAVPLGDDLFTNAGFDRELVTGRVVAVGAAMDAKLDAPGSETFSLLGRDDATGEELPADLITVATTTYAGHLGVMPSGASGRPWETQGVAGEQQGVRDQ